MNGHEVFDRVWYNDNMCCAAPIKFTIQATAECTEEDGLHSVHLDIPYLDLIEFNATKHSGWNPLYAFERGRMNAIRALEAPFKYSFLSALNGIFKEKTSKIRIQTEDETINPMAYISHMMEQ